MWLLRCKPLGHSKWLPDLSQINSCGKLDTHHHDRLVYLALGVYRQRALPSRDD